jgi:hypothetical protein
MNPPAVETAPDDNQVIANDLFSNGLNPPPGDFAPFASDILLLGGTNNCFSDNTAALTIPSPLPGCS